MAKKSMIVRTEDRHAAQDHLHQLLMGLCRRFKDPEDYLSEDLIETIQDINAKILPKVKFERSWDDHFHLIDIIIEANNEDTLLFKVRYKRLGNLGILLTTEYAKDVDPDEVCAPPSPYHPFAILLAANIKHQFRDLSVTIKPTVWKKRTSETEIIMQ
jgi:hypothetical protein